MSSVPAKDETEEPKDEKKKKKEKNVIPTKVVIRRLPPGMVKDDFLKLVGPLPDHDYFRFVTGDRTLQPNNFSRAYINFINLPDIVKFRDKFDGLELTDKNEIKSQCIVELAPFQKVPKKLKKKDDPKANSIEQDAEYMKFLESLEDEDEKNILDVEKYLEELEQRDKHSSEAVDTPLTAFIKQKREERKKLREERKRLDIERRKKKDEERRKRRELDRKKRTETEKLKKKKEVNGNDDPKKKTLAETMRSGDRSRPSSGGSKNLNDEDLKMKILQKDSGDQKKQNLAKTQNNSTQSTKNDLKENSNRDNPRKSQTLKESALQRYREDEARKSQDGDRKEEHKFKGLNKKPDREIYRPGSPRGRGGPGAGYRASSARGGSTRPQKYSEQRNRSTRKSESDQ